MANESSTTRVRVRTTQEGGRRRARFFITREWSFLDVTPEELAALEGDATLAVVPAKPGDEEKIAEEKLAMDPAAIDPSSPELFAANNEERVRRGLKPLPHPDTVIHPLGDNLTQPPTTVPDTSDEAIAKRREEDRKLGQVQRTLQPALPVKIVSDEETASTETTSTDGGEGTSEPTRGRRQR